MATFFTIIILVHVALGLLLLWVERTLPRIDKTSALKLPTSNLPLVSIIIPARNEENNIGDCVQAALSQTYANLEVIVVDDNSDDATGEVLSRLQCEAPKLHIISGKPLCPGWLGKPWALWQGQQHAKGEYLLFVDADARLKPDCVAAVMAVVLAERLPFLTLTPTIEVKSFWEHVAQAPFVALLLNMIPADKLSQVTSSEVVCNGPFMLFRNDVYDAIGGHYGVRADIVEDHGLGVLLKKHGYGITYALGQSLYSLRMYESLEEIWRGWSKNTFVGLKRSILFTAFTMLLVSVVFVLPWVIVPIAVFGTLFGWSMGSGLLAGIFVLTRLLHRQLIERLMGVSARRWHWEWLGYAIMIGIMANSARLHVGKKPVAWRGRNISLDQ